MMKKLVMALCIFLVGITAGKAQTTEQLKGIHFFAGTYKAALAKAQAENKPIFVNIYATWCAPCNLLESIVFTNKKVGIYYDAHFVCLSLNGEQGEGAQLAQDFGIQGYPSLIFLNKTGTTMMYDAGYRGPRAFIKTGENAFTQLLNAK